jgi:hypothetical protein
MSKQLNFLFSLDTSSNVVIVDCASHGVPAKKD